MPDPFEYLQALVTAAGLSALVAFGLARWRVPVNVVCGLAVSAGIACGACVLKLPVWWPPSTGLGRLFTMLLPAAICVEAVLGLPAVPQALLWSGRLLLAMVAARILLHGSVYISGDHPEWSTWQAIWMLAGSGTVLIVVWALLTTLAKRSDGISIPLAIAECILCSGLTVMLKGYVGGGEASLPIVAALAGYSILSGVYRDQHHIDEGAIVIGIVALFGLLFVGHFFGKLSGTSALVLFLAPLLCWASELSLFRRRAAWQKALLRLVAVAVPLIAVVIFAKHDFDRGLRPLLRPDAARATLR